MAFPLTTTNTQVKVENFSSVLDSTGIIELTFDLMKKYIFATLLAFALLEAPSVSAQQIRIATVDMKRVFDSYYKTKQAEAQIKDRAGDSDKVYKGMVDDYQK